MPVGSTHRLLIVVPDCEGLALEAGVSLGLGKRDSEP